MPNTETKVHRGPLASVARRVVALGWECRRDPDGHLAIVVELERDREKVLIRHWSPGISDDSAPGGTMITFTIGVLHQVPYTEELRDRVLGTTGITGEVGFEPYEDSDLDSVGEEPIPVRLSLKESMSLPALYVDEVVTAAEALAESARALRRMIVKRYDCEMDPPVIGEPFTVPLTLDPALHPSPFAEAPAAPVFNGSGGSSIPLGDPQSEGEFPEGLKMIRDWVVADASRLGFEEINPLVLAQVLAKRRSPAFVQRLGAARLKKLIALDPKSIEGNPLLENGPAKVDRLLRQTQWNAEPWELYLTKVVTMLLVSHPEILDLVGHDPVPRGAGKGGPSGGSSGDPGPVRRGGGPGSYSTPWMRRRRMRDGSGVIPPVPESDEYAESADGPLRQRTLVRPIKPRSELIDALKDRVKGQDHVIEPVASRVVMARKGLAGRAKTKPDGVFLFAGPTGVGKTELAKALANEVYGDRPNNMIRLDMSEYYDRWAISRLIGSNPGYLGYDDPGGWLTTRIIENPECVLLLDEFEKASRQVQFAMLQVFDEGRLTSGHGTVAHFDQTIVVLTSNLGSSSFTRQEFGFAGSDEPDMDDLNRARSRDVMAAIRKDLPPELFNRLDGTLVFNAMSESLLSEIAESKLARTRVDLAEVGYDIEFAADVKDLVARLDWDPALGARPLIRTIDRVVREPLIDLEPGRYRASVAGDRLAFDALAERGCAPNEIEGQVSLFTETAAVGATRAA